MELKVYHNHINTTPSFIRLILNGIERYSLEIIEDLESKELILNGIESVTSYIKYLLFGTTLILNGIES